MDINISQPPQPPLAPNGFFKPQILLPAQPGPGFPHVEHQLDPTNGAACFPIRDCDFPPLSVNASPPPYSPPGYPGYGPTVPTTAPETQDARRCADCKAFLDSDLPEFAKRCRDCYKVYVDAWADMPKRNCSFCKEQKIPADAPEWKQVCGPCFREHSRKCEDCDKNIAPNAPKYQKRCHGCFLAKRSQTHNPCPTCPPHLAKHLRKLKADPMCTTCKKALGGGISRTAVPMMPNLARTTTVAF